MTLKEYLEHRFLINNHSKYQKYRTEWVNNVLNNPTAYNIEYFIKEKEKLGL